ncbi:AfsA-related hotdog domain-containing protein [Paracoccus aminophilus]|uniref:A-factor biosynthesis hotdog domain-containing protein n=1 Tax=Paracoccus aminophilus JCM 7686 TaxID=1367847 RepID=S5XUE2_PARAH|nr:AfsA-related hotdog domain-containing protein [Paracoccus aminophilus]AGT08827.1 hypothetical protein JCM7686_1726 [Paracoccus aminophilus JCM 7686]
MIAFHHLPVDANLVHKDNLDDVLISNQRTELPTWLSIEDLDADILSKDDRDLLLQYYTRATEADGLHYGHGAHLLRRSVPQILPLDVAEQPDFEFVTDHYKVTPEHLVLHSKYLPEEQEAQLAAHFLPVMLQLEDTERVTLTRLTAHVQSNEKPNRYYFNMINDLRNYFFYRKHHEHVPGLMLVEAARQAVYAQYYNTGIHQRGEVTLTMSELNCKFESYVESNYPVSLCVETIAEDGEARVSGQMRRQVRFYQNGRRVAVIDAAGIPIKLKLFNRLRVVRPNPEHWFVPVKGFASSAVFFSPDGKRVEGKLKRVARNAMEISFDRVPPLESPLNFVLAIDGIGYVDGSVRLDELREEGKNLLCRFSVESLTAEAERRWLEAIKTFSHIAPRLGAH